MKKRLVRSIICFLLSVMLFAESASGTMNVYATEAGEESENQEEEIITATSYLYPFEEAVASLEQLAYTREIQAVVYLSDNVFLRMLPEEGSEPVKNLVSGDVVKILGVGQDAEYNIWYHVTFTDEIEEVTGYIRKENLACVDEEFMKWQENYVRSIGMFGRFGKNYAIADIAEFPESYQEALLAIKEKHPNWIFVKMNTNIDWKNLVRAQLGNPSWIWTPTAKENWKNGATGTTNWSYASEGIIKYYLDPRNFLSQKDIFQFEWQGYVADCQTAEAVESLLSGSFMANKVIDNGKTYAQTFAQIGKEVGVSPFLMAARVRQEQGQGKNVLISGTYKGYEGYYNYYNIGAYGKNSEETILNGFKTAVAKRWDSQYKSLKGGGQFLADEYINAGQDTLYLQKFDVDDSAHSVFTHQYMQNIQAPSQEASSVYTAYNNKGLLNQPFIFKIPVYQNMPVKAVPLPGEEDQITINRTSIDNLQVDSEITLRPLVNGKETEGMNWSFTSSDTGVATVDNYGVVKALKAGETTITCKSLDDPDNPNVGTCKIKVIPADIDITKLEIPKLADITYDANQTLKDITLKEGYSWADPDMVPIVAQSAYGVIYSPDEEKYNPITFDITLNVIKKVLASTDYSIPTDLEGGATRELASIILPVGFIWDNPQEILPDTIGMTEYTASYNPDSANCETVTDIKIKVKIVCEKHDFSEWVITEATCDVNGSKVRECSVCQSKEELILEKLGHSYESEITLEATEEAEGIRTYNCVSCGHSYTESIPKLPSTHVHNYEESIVKKASCTEDGEKVFECICSDKYTEVIIAEGHKVENGRCINCGYTDIVEIPDQENNGNGDSNGGTGNSTPSGSNNGTGDNTSNGSNSGTDNSTPSGSNNGTGDNTSNGSNSGTDDNASSGSNSSATGNSNGVNNNSVGTNNNTIVENNSSNTNVNNSTDINSSTATDNTVVENNTMVTNSNTTENNTTETNTNTIEDKLTETNTNTTENKIEASGNSTTGQNTPNVNTTSAETETNGKKEQVEVDLMAELIDNAKQESTEEGRPTVSIRLNKNTEISQKLVEMAKEQGVDLEVNLSNELTWNIKADSLTGIMPSAINMNAEIVHDVIQQDIIDAVTSENEYMELSLSHDGEFGFEATLIIPVEEKYSSQIANLFYFNEKTKALEFQMATPVDEENKIQLEFIHASDYVIVFAQNSLAEIVTTVTDETDTEVENITKEVADSNGDKNNTNGLLIVSIIVMIFAGGLTVVGYFIYCNKKEISDGQDFESWLKNDGTSNAEGTKKKESAMEETDYLDDDVDDYREKEVVSSSLSNTGRILLSGEPETEEYLDDDVDDYKEKE